MSIEVGQLVKVRENSRQVNWSQDPVMQDTLGQIGRVIYKYSESPCYKVKFLFDDFCFNEEDLELITLGMKESVSAEFNWKEFFNNSEIAVHCSTEEQAKDFCKQMHKQMLKHGLEWESGEGYLKTTRWEVEGENTCYTGYGAYASIEFYEDNDYTILEWSNYMKKGSE